MGMSLIVRKVTQFVIGLIYLFGVNIIAFGHLTPGGGFPGGVILACGFILVMLAFGKETALRKVSPHTAHILDTFGASSFLLIALLGYAGGAFFLNVLDKGTPFHLLSAGTIPLANLAIGIKVFASIFIAAVALSLFGRWTDTSRIEEKGDID